MEELPGEAHEQLFYLSSCLCVCQFDANPAWPLEQEGQYLLVEGVALVRRALQRQGAANQAGIHHLVRTWISYRAGSPFR